MNKTEKPRFLRLWPGVALCVAIALPAQFIGKIIPVMGGPVAAILLGVALGGLLRRAVFKPGVGFASKKILQYSIILLGFDMNLRQIVEVGSSSLLLIFSTITVSLVVAYLLTKALKIPANMGILIGVGSSICGGSAIAATAPVLGAQDDEIAGAVSTIFLFNVIAALIFPSLGWMMGLSDTGFGLWAGTAINDTSSVVAAATTWSNAVGNNVALNLATIVKLTRTLAIIPITFVLALYTTRKKEKAAQFKLSKIFPWFILLFLLASVIKTATNMPAEFSKPLVSLGKFMITVAMAGIGLNTNPKELVKKGGKPILLGFCCWAAIALVALGTLYIQNRW